MAAEQAHALAVCEAEVLSFMAPLEQVRQARRGGRLGCRGARELQKFTTPFVDGAQAGRMQGAGRVAAGAQAAAHATTHSNLSNGHLTHNPAKRCALQLTAAEVRRVEEAQAGRQRLVESLDRLKQRVANLE